MKTAAGQVTMNDANADWFSIPSRWLSEDVQDQSGDCCGGGERSKAIVADFSGLRCFQCFAKFPHPGTA